MTPEQLALVRRTAVSIEATRHEFGRRFYGHLFELDPSTRRLFPDDNGAQASRFTDEVLGLVAIAGDLPVFLERARALGERHRRYGVHAADYPVIGDALVAAVADIAEADWSPLADASWHCMFALIAEGMIEGACGGLFGPAG
jgi:hemoglobin-like flavoprotein